MISRRIEIPNWKVKENLKNKVVRENQTTFLFLQKVREILGYMLDAHYHEIKSKCCDFHLKYVVIIIHAPGKTNHKMLKMVTAICVEI